MTGLLELAARCKQSTKPSRLLDFEIHIAAVGDALWPVIERNGRVSNPNSRMSDYLEIYRDNIDADDQDFDFPRYTASMDAAMSLFPSNLQWLEMNLSWDTIGCWPAVSVRWYPPGHDGKHWHGCVSSGATCALALCNAAIEIRARQLSDTHRPEVGR